MRKFKYTLLVVVGLLFFAATQYASGPQKVKSGPGPVRQWGSGPAATTSGPSGVEPVLGSCGFTTLRFDELPFQPVNGLIFRGAIFSFRVDGVASTDAVYNASGPGIQTFVQDPVLEGSAFGELTVEFPALTPTLTFGIARNTFATLTPGATVALFDEFGVPIGTFPVDLAPTFPGGFAENLFSYSGPTLVRRAVITFDSPEAAERFALDNLTYVAFPLVLQDDANPNLVLQINPITGEYEFINCATGTTLFGRGGAANNFGCGLFFGAGGGNKGGPAIVNATVNRCARTGTATVRVGATTFTINDSNIDDNLCCEGEEQGGGGVVVNKK